ncbi:hypothetical protein AVEN_26107-1 [Araneus ventricosus]|uniref:Uncharacterized protein n=1 Tax=Araneus ventricosus TaxID=182803 RepID=A0A4Y2NHW0_ARAVE|nr:hypothetical protein AVEN_26107-1 [Araneus ventricosus]
MQERAFLVHVPHVSLLIEAWKSGVEKVKTVIHDHSTPCKLHCGTPHRSIFTDLLKPISYGHSDPYCTYFSPRLLRFPLKRDSPPPPTPRMHTGRISSFMSRPVVARKLELQSPLKLF